MRGLVDKYHAYYNFNGVSNSPDAKPIGKGIQLPFHETNYLSLL